MRTVTPQPVFPISLLVQLWHQDLLLIQGDRVLQACLSVSPKRKRWEEALLTKKTFSGLNSMCMSKRKSTHLKQIHDLLIAFKAKVVGLGSRRYLALASDVPQAQSHTAKFLRKYLL